MLGKKYCDLFIKEKDSLTRQEMHEKAGMLGSLTGLCVNLLLAAMKIVIGLISASVAILGDGLNNLSDAGGSLVALITVRIAKKPYDAEHPFGHGRVEYLGALSVGVIIILFAVSLFRSSIDSILSSEIPGFSAVTIIFLVLGIVMKCFLWRLYGYIGKTTDNPTMTAASKDSFGDVLSTSAVLLSAVILMIFGVNLDGYMGILVSLLVLKAGVEVLWEMINKLLGGKPDYELGAEIIKRIKSTEGVVGIHDFVLHDYGPGRCMASVHVEVPAEGDIIEIHEMIDRIESQILDELNIPICIHMDPVISNDKETEEIKLKIKNYLESREIPLSMHDFRRVPGEKRVNLIFDVLVDPRIKDKEGLRKEIQDYATSIDPAYMCVIRFDMDYYGSKM